MSVFVIDKNGKSLNCIEYTDEVKKALEKQAPKDLILENRTHVCPNCKKIYFYMKFCGNCGQKLNEIN